MTLRLKKETMLIKESQLRSIIRDILIEENNEINEIDFKKGLDKAKRAVGKALTIPAFIGMLTGSAPSGIANERHEDIQRYSKEIVHNIERDESVSVEQYIELTSFIMSKFRSPVSPQNSYFKRVTLPFLISQIIKDFKKSNVVIDRTSISGVLNTSKGKFNEIEEIDIFTDINKLNPNALYYYIEKGADLSPGRTSYYTLICLPTDTAMIRSHIKDAQENAGKHESRNESFRRTIRKFI